VQILHHWSKGWCCASCCIYPCSSFYASCVGF